jgi:ribonucleoside-triphosphate reductase
MNEACLHLFGENIAHDRSRAFAGRVLDRMRELLAAFQRETGSRYNLEATPAEGATYRLAQLDRKSFPGMHPETGSAPFYTNSTHLPVDFTDDPFAALDLQDDLQVKYTGGTVLHLFLKERVDDVRAIRSLVRTVCSRYRLPYFTITPTFSVCPTHGYLAGEKKSCPVCGGPTEVYSRVVGYLRPVAQWNDGKRSEFAARHCFTVKKSRDAHADRRDRSVLAD